MEVMDELLGNTEGFGDENAISNTGGGNYSYDDSVDESSPNSPACVSF